MDLGEKNLSDPINRWFFAHAKKDAYLVGGYVRDLLIGHDSKDNDFVLKDNAGEIARKAAKKFNGTFIELQKKQTFRVALEDKRFIDFTSLTNGIVDNLYERDFTVNAIAWSPGTGIVAPQNHLDDLQKRVIKVVRHKNLLNDPLRILRAYRLSAQLKFDIESATRSYLRKYATELTKAAPERITEELFKILNNDNSAKYLRLCLIDKVISNILPLTPLIIKNNISILDKFDGFAQKIIKLQKNKFLQSYFDSEFSQVLKVSGLIRFYLLTRNINFNKTARLKYKENIFQELKFLKLSHKIRNSLQNLVNAELLSYPRITEKRLFEMFKRAEDNVYEIAIIQSLLKSSRQDRFINKANDFLKMKNQILLNGDEIRKLLNIESGKLVGYIKDKIFENQFYGVIKNKREAGAWIISNFT